MITVAITDANHRIVPTADELVHFELSGPGKILGVGNGNPSCLEPDIYPSKPALRSGSMNEWWMNTVSDGGEHREVAEKFNETRWNLTDVSGDANTVEGGKSAVFRAHLFLTEADLALTNVTLIFGAIQGEARIYVNGKLAGESLQEADSPTFNLRKFVRAGLNAVAVLVKCGPTGGGISHGVHVELRDQPAIAHWQRSTFNGLAQVLVQSDGNAGEIRLTATADGVSPATTVISSHPCLSTSETP